MATDIIRLPGSAPPLFPGCLCWELAMVLKGLGTAARPSPQPCVPVGYFLIPPCPSSLGQPLAHPSFMRGFPEGLLFTSTGHGTVNPWRRDRGEPLGALQLFIKHLSGISCVSKKPLRSLGFR